MSIVGLVGDGGVIESGSRIDFKGKSLTELPERELRASAQPGQRSQSVSPFPSRRRRAIADRADRL
jgi:hypothetical protein